MELGLELELELILQTPLFLVPLGLWTPNLAGWWFRMRGPHPQSHVILRYRGHVTNKKRYISTFTRPMDPKLIRVVTYDERTSPAKSHRSHRSHRSRGHVSSQNISSPHSQVPRSLVGCWIRMRGPHPKSHGHVKNQNRHISSTIGSSRCKRKAYACQKQTQKCQQNVEMK